MRPTSDVRVLDRIRPVYIFGFGLAYLFFAWFVSYLGDVHNFLALTDRLINRGAERPFMWYYLFIEGSPTEMLQWTYLTITVILCGCLVGQLAERGYRLPAQFFGFMAAGTGIMLMEDAGNLRHRIKFYIRLAFGDTMALGIAVELVLYAILGAFMIYVLVRFWRYPWRHRQTRNYMLAGYVLYAVAAVASATRHLGDWYDHAGAWLLSVAGLSEPFNALFVPTAVGRPIGFYIMDFLVEESIELLAASALCASVFAYLREFQRNPGIASLDDPD